MRRQRLNSILACLMLLASLLSTSEARAWYCDGRVCSIEASCCCLSSQLKQDAKCRQQAADAVLNSLCGGGCKCKLVIKAGTSQDAAMPSVLVHASPIAIVPEPPAEYVAPAAAKTVLPHIETRGPPRATLLFATPSLRAPPIA